MFYSLSKASVKAFIYLYHRVKVIGKELLPKTGRLIIVGNHSSYLDPIYIVALLPRKIHFMAKEEIFKSSLLRPILKFSGSFPVNRDKPDLKTFKTALHHLNQERVIGIFPEGGIVEENAFQDLKQGAAYLAIKSGARVLPVYIDGTRKAMEEISVIKPVKIKLLIGKPLELPKEGTLKEKQLELSLSMQKALQDLSTTCRTKRKKRINRLKRLKIRSRKSKLKENS